MSSSSSTVLISNNPETDRSSSGRRYNKKKRLSQSLAQQRVEHTLARWRSEAQQRLYSSKLIQALSKVNLNPSSPSAPRRGRAVREAADRALAVAAKGRSLWSRAILSSRVKLKFRKPQNRRHSPSRVITASSETSIGSSSRSSTKPRASVMRLKGMKSLPAVQRKARVLGRLVPGCRKQPLPVVLDEATDYIAALEMQIKTMSALAELLSGGTFPSSSASDSASTPPSIR